MNALEHVVLPRFRGVLRYIDQELEELERENYFRLKKVLENKQKKDEETEIENMRKEKERLEAGEEIPQ